MDSIRLRESLRGRGVRQNELQRILGVSRSTCYRKCRGSSSFSPTELQLLRTLLGEEEVDGIFGLGGAK